MTTERRTDPTREGQRLAAPADVAALHRPLLREAREPVDGREPAPWWIWALVVGSLFSGGFYLGRYGGTFTNTPHIGYVVKGPGDVVPAADLPKAPVSGPKIYAERCASCHQQDGRGLPGAFPPLVGSEWVRGDPKVPVATVLHGLAGPITVAGAQFNGAMPAWKDMLSDEEIAAVVTHVRGMAGAEPVDAAFVKATRDELAARTTNWTADELKALGGGR